MIWLLAFVLASSLSTAAFGQDVGRNRSNFDFWANTFSTTTHVHTLLVDPFGRRTGCTVDDCFREIPGGNSGVESVDNDRTGEQGIESDHVFLRPVIPGTYTVVLFALATTRYSLFSGARDSAGKDAAPSPVDLEGFLTAGTTRQYVLFYDPAPGAPKSIIKTVSFQTLRQDLQTAFQLGQIGDAKFVAKLDKTLAKGEKALAKKKENRKEAVEKLRKFVRRLEKAAKKEPDEDDEDDEEDRKEGKKMKRFVTPEALGALAGDARILIAQLRVELREEKDKDDED